MTTVLLAGILEGGSLFCCVFSVFHCFIFILRFHDFPSFSSYNLSPFHLFSNYLRADKYIPRSAPVYLICRSLSFCYSPSLCLSRPCSRIFAPLFYSLPFVIRSCFRILAISMFLIHE
ncbi:hypothetical protein V8F20_005561 [Naviculisporaceae sp. PSN 640]